MLNAGCAHVGPSRAHVEPSGPSWAYVGHVEPCWTHLGPILALCWAMLGSSWAFEHCKQNTP